LEYIACLGGARPKITGVLHAGTWDSHDFTVRQGMRPWGHSLEQAWFAMFDLIFVATKFHKELILLSHRVDPDKIVVTGLPFYPADIKKYDVKRDDSLIIFPHRLDIEKHPEDFDGLITDITAGGILAKSLKTADFYSAHGYTKEKYHRALQQATIAVSTATQETFGYSMLEATACGCVPLVPDRLSYQELYPTIFRYQTLYELRAKVLTVLHNLSYYCQEASRLAQEHEALYTNSISTMIYTIRQRFGHK